MKPYWHRAGLLQLVLWRASLFENYRITSKGRNLSEACPFFIFLFHAPTRSVFRFREQTFLRLRMNVRLFQLGVRLSLSRFDLLRAWSKHSQRLLSGCDAWGSVFAVWIRPRWPHMILHVQRNRVIVCTLTPAAAKTCQYELLASIFMDITHTVRNILKLLNLNVLNFTVVLQLCESVVVLAWDCLVPGWITILKIFLFCYIWMNWLGQDVEQFEEMLLRQWCCVCIDFIMGKIAFLCHRKQNSKLDTRFRTVAYYLFSSQRSLLDVCYEQNSKLSCIYCFRTEFGLQSSCWVHPDFLFGGCWRI